MQQSKKVRFGMELFFSIMEFNDFISIIILL